MSESTVEPVSPPVQVAINPRALVPLGCILVGYGVLLLGLVLIRDPLWSMALVLTGGGLVATGHILVPLTPVFLPLANLAALIYLVIQGLGYCSYHCDGFVDYRRIGVVPTAWAGALLHLGLIMLGMLRSRVPFISAQAYRMLLGVGQGASLYFLVLMVAHQHWCPACAAAHVAMIGQAIILSRLTEAGRSMHLYVATVLVTALTVNAVFHHRFDRPEMAPGDALTGFLVRARDHGQVGVVVPMDQLAATPAALVPERDSKHDASRDQAALATLAGIEAVRTEGFWRWGADTAPIIMRAHMSVACPGCQAHWAKMDDLREQVDSGKLQVEFFFTWPTTPRSHYGASLATYVLYAAGMLGEHELLAAGDRLFGINGVQLVNQIDAVLAAEAKGGTAIPADSEKDALATLFQFINTDVPASRAISAYSANKRIIDERIQANVGWLVDFGRKDTPHYFYLQRGAPDAPYWDTTSLDKDVVATAVLRGIQKNTVAPRKGTP